MPTGPGAVLAAPRGPLPKHSVLTEGVELLDAGADGDSTLTQDSGQVHIVESGGPSIRARASGDRWQNGIEFTPECAAVPQIRLNCVDEVSDALDDAPNVGPPVLFTPYEVITGVHCSTSGMRGLDLEGRAARRLDTTLAWGIERELWRGDQARAHSVDNMYLSAPGFLDAADIIGGLAPGSSMPLVYALAALQQALAGYGTGGVGTIHMTRYTATLLYSASAITPFIDEDGNYRIIDLFGNRIIAGAGYDGSSDGSSPSADFSTAWMYATTGPVYYIIGERIVDGYDDIDPGTGPLSLSTNDVDIYSRAVAAALWDDCVRLGVLVNHCDLTCS